MSIVIWGGGVEVGESLVSFVVDTQSEGVVSCSGVESAWPICDVCHCAGAEGRSVKGHPLVAQHR